jgi:hypothetical protein
VHLFIAKASILLPKFMRPNVHEVKKTGGTRHLDASSTPLSGHTCVLRCVIINCETDPTVHNDSALLTAFGICSTFVKNFNFEFEFTDLPKLHHFESCRIFLPHVMATDLTEGT